MGNTIIVAGGWDWLCPPDSDCVSPRTPPFADGAAHDLETGQWTRIADAPIGVFGTVTAVVGDDVYALSQCDSGPTCPGGGSLLRYGSQADTWDIFPSPGQSVNRGLISVAEGVVAYSQTDENGVRPDYLFLAAEERWVALASDPLPPVYDRFVVEYGGRYLLFGTPIDGGGTKLASAYDPETDAWQELAASGTQGYQVWRAGASLYLNPHFGNAAGGIYDPDLNRWRPLPDPPHYDLAGVIASNEANYAYPDGWVLDTRGEDLHWIEIEPRPDSRDVYDEVVANGPQQGLLVFGGQTWTSGEGQLVNDLWLWRPPAPPASPR